MASRHPSAWLLALFCVGCTVDPVDLDDKSCPCAQGLVCDEPRDRCVEGPLPDGGADASPPDAAGDAGGDDAGPPGVVTSGFGFGWATANAIRWQWEPTGSRADFFGYEVLLAEQREHIEDPQDLGPTARVVDREQNPELGVYALPRTNDDGDIVTATITRGLEPDTSYFARLVTTDTSLRRHVSSIAAGTTTLAPTETVDIYGDGTSGYLQPSAAMAESGDAPHGGDSHLRYDPTTDPECDADGELCYQNLRIQGLGIDATAGGSLSEGDFASTAFLEMAVSHEGDGPSFWSIVWLKVGACDDSSVHSINALTLPATGEYEVFQFPLRALRGWADDETLSHAELAGSALCGVNVGGEWHRDAPVDVDEIAIRY